MRSRNLVLAWRNLLGGAQLTFPAPVPAQPARWESVEHLSNWFRARSALVRAGSQPLTASWATPQLFDLVALPWHTLPAGATFDLTFSMGGAVVYTSGTLPAWPDMPWGTVDFGDPSWWGHMTDPEQQGEWDGFARHLLPHTVLADTLTMVVTTPDDARLPLWYAGPAVQVTDNYEFGATEGWAGVGDAEGAELGVPLGGTMAPEPRTLRLRLPKLTDEECLLGLTDLVRICGRGRQPFLVLPDPGEDWSQARRSMVAFLRALPDLEKVRRGFRAVSLDMVEWRI